MATSVNTVTGYLKTLCLFGSQAGAHWSLTGILGIDSIEVSLNASGEHLSVYNPWLGVGLHLPHPKQKQHLLGEIAKLNRLGGTARITGGVPAGFTAEARLAILDGELTMNQLKAAIQDVIRLSFKYRAAELAALSLAPVELPTPIRTRIVRGLSSEDSANGSTIRF